MGHLYSINSDCGVWHGGIACGAEASLGRGETTQEPPLIFLFPSPTAGIPALLSCCSPAAVPSMTGWRRTALSPFPPADLAGAERRVSAPQLRSPQLQSRTPIIPGAFCASSPPKNLLHGVEKSLGRGDKAPSTTPAIPLFSAWSLTPVYPKENLADVPFTKGRRPAERRWCLCGKPGNREKSVHSHWP